MTIRVTTPITIGADIVSFCALLILLIRDHKQKQVKETIDREMLGASVVHRIADRLSS